MNNIPLEKLLNTIRTLRSENGCPWDRKQTPESLIKYLKEEVTELIEAIGNKDVINVQEEIGDVLYVLIMISEIYSDKNVFSFNDSVTEINTKLIRRHPHVFAGKKMGSDEDLRLQWEKIKKNEKKKID